MKVLLVNTTDKGGGAEKVTQQILVGLNDRGIESNLLVGKKNTENNKIIEIERNIVDRVITKLINIYQGNKNNGYFSSKKKFKRLINSTEFDIVHYHNIHGSYFNINNVSEGLKLPSVWTLHDMWAFTGRCAYAFDCNKWMNGCEKCENLDYYPSSKYDDANKTLNIKKELFMNQNMHIVTPSNWLKKLVEKSILGDLNIRTIYNGVDTEKFKVLDKFEVRNKYNINSKKTYILFLSAYLNDNRKGFKYLIDALNMIENKEKFGILVAGNNLDESILDSGFEIHQFGYISEESKLNEIYSLADVFVTPTLADNFPCTIIESMSSGTPVIAFNVGGISEQIDSECGWLIEPKDTIGLFNAIREVETDKDMARRKGNNSRDKVEKYFSLDMCIENYKKLYEEIIGKE